MTYIIGKVVSHLQYKKANDRLLFLEAVADDLKYLDQHSDELKKKLEEEMKESSSDKGDDAIEKDLKDLEDIMNKKRIKLNRENVFRYNWFAILFIIPRFETALMLVLLSLMLTSYDIHPLGCISPINVSYNQIDRSVTLSASESIIKYQKAAVIITAILVLLWVVLKFFQFLLLPRINWCLLIVRTNRALCCCRYMYKLKRYKANAN